MDKKAIMLKFLATTILALLIFGSSFAILAKVFRNSDQAVANFRDFTDGLDDFVKSRQDEQSLLLIMDQETGIFVFADRNRVKAYDSFILEAGLEGPSHHYKTIHYYLPFPERSANCAEGSCACLCQTFEERTAIKFNEEIVFENGGEVSLVEADISCPKLRCVDTSDLDFAASFSRYRYTDGEEPANYDNLRRTLVSLQKTEKGILIQEK